LRIGKKLGYTGFKKGGKMKRIFLAVLAIILVAGLIVTGCAAPAPPAPTPPTPAPPTPTPPTPAPPALEIPTGELPPHVVASTFHMPFSEQIVLYKVWEDDLGIPVIGRTAGGVAAATPLIMDGTLDAYWGKGQGDYYATYNGIGVGKDLGPSDVRFLMCVQRGGLRGFWARKGSGIETINDFIGKKGMVHSAADYEESMVYYTALKVADVLGKYTDIRDVSAVGRKAPMAEGRIDFMGFPISSTYQRTVKDTGGGYPISVPEEIGKGVNELLPSVKWGYNQERYFDTYGIPRETGGFIMKMGHMVSAKMDDYLAYRMTKAFWENLDKMAEATPEYTDYNIEMNVALDNIIPFHPGAIAYYKEKGIWTAESDQRQQELLANQGKAKIESWLAELVE